jgi:hypothetical protein
LCAPERRCEEQCDEAISILQLDAFLDVNYMEAAKTRWMIIRHPNLMAGDYPLMVVIDSLYPVTII